MKEVLGIQVEDIKVMVTDDEPALYNAIEKVFPETQHMLCIWRVFRISFFVPLPLGA